jgi:L-ascorbate metabolism protein UlaG (beta-lactamase superfamily)
MLDIQYIRAATLLIEWDGLKILTDPWFARRMRGLPVYVRPCLDPEDLPPLDLILVSHFHPDHFDAEALCRLRHPCRLIVGLPGLAARCRDVPHERVLMPTPGEVVCEAEFTVRAFAVEHSGPENAYLVERRGQSLLFAGDARYTPVFREIGQAYQPTVALLPIGGTEILGRRIVMNPADALQAAMDLRAQVLVPIHLGGEWMSVPPLSRHPGRAADLVALAEARGAALTVAPLVPGERVTVDAGGRVQWPTKRTTAAENCS